MVAIHRNLISCTTKLYTFGAPFLLKVCEIQQYFAVFLYDSFANFGFADGIEVLTFSRWDAYRENYIIKQKTKIGSPGMQV